MQLATFAPQLHTDVPLTAQAVRPLRSRWLACLATPRDRSLAQCVCPSGEKRARTGQVSREIASVDRHHSSRATANMSVTVAVPVF